MGFMYSVRWGRRGPCSFRAPSVTLMAFVLSLLRCFVTPCEPSAQMLHWSLYPKQHKRLLGLPSRAVPFTSDVHTQQRWRSVQLQQHLQTVIEEQQLQMQKRQHQQLRVIPWSHAGRLALHGEWQ